MYLQDIVSSRRTRFNSVFIFNCPFFFFSASDDIGIERELFLPESTFTYTAVKARTLWSFFFYSEQMQREEKKGAKWLVAVALRHVIKLIMFLWRKWSKFPDK